MTPKRHTDTAVAPLPRHRVCTRPSLPARFPPAPTLSPDPPGPTPGRRAAASDEELLSQYHRGQIQPTRGGGGAHSPAPTLGHTCSLLPVLCTLHLLLPADQTALADKRLPEMHRPHGFIPFDAKMTLPAFFLLPHFIIQLSLSSTKFKETICTSKTFHFQLDSAVYSKAFCYSEAQRTNTPTNNVSLGYENQRTPLLSASYSGTSHTPPSSPTWCS